CPIQGRTGEQGLPLVLRWTWSTASGSRRQLATSPHYGDHAILTPAGSDPPALDIAPPTVVPARDGRQTVFDGLRLVGVPVGAEGAVREMGMVIDGPARTCTAVVAVRCHSFALV